TGHVAQRLPELHARDGVARRERDELLEGRDRAAAVAKRHAALSETAPGLGAAGKPAHGLLVLGCGVAPALRSRVCAAQVVVDVVAVDASLLHVAQARRRVLVARSAYRDERVLHRRAERLVVRERVLGIGACGRSSRSRARSDITERAQSLAYVRWNGRACVWLA